MTDLATLQAEYDKLNAHFLEYRLNSEELEKELEKELLQCSEENETLKQQIATLRESLNSATELQNSKPINVSSNANHVSSIANDDVMRMMDDLERLKNEVVFLKEKLVSLEIQNYSLEEKDRQASEEIELWKAKYEQEEENVLLLRDQLENVNMHLETIQRLKDENRELRNELEIQKASVESSSKQGEAVNQLNQSIETLSTSIKEKDEKIEQLEHESHQTRREIEILNVKLEKDSEERSKLLNDIQEKDKKLKNLTERFEALDIELDQLSASKSAIQKHSENLQAEKDALIETKKQLEDQISKLNEEVKALEFKFEATKLNATANANNEMKLSHLERELKDAIAEKYKFQEQVNALQERITELENKLSDASELENQRKELELELTQQRQTGVELKEKSSSQLKLIAELNEEIEKLRLQLSIKSHTIQDLETQNDTLRLEQEESSKKYNSMIEIINLRDEGIRQLEEEILSLKQRILASDEENVNLKKQLKGLEEGDQSTIHLKQLNSDLESQLLQLQEHQLALKEEVELLKKKLHDSEKTCNSQSESITTLKAQLLEIETTRETEKLALVKQLESEQERFTQANLLAESRLIKINELMVDVDNNSNMYSQSTKLAEENSRIKEQLKAIQEANSSLQKECEESKTILKVLSHKYNDLELRLDKQGNEKSYSTIKEELDHALEVISQKDSEIQKYKRDASNNITMEVHEGLLRQYNSIVASKEKLLNQNEALLRQNETYVQKLTALGEQIQIVSSDEGFNWDSKPNFEEMSLLAHSIRNRLEAISFKF